jgi:2-isopropylmalate synthase
VGVNENVIEASWHALVDSIEYKLYKDEAQGTPISRGETVHNSAEEQTNR